MISAYKSIDSRCRCFWKVTILAVLVLLTLPLPDYNPENLEFTHDRDQRLIVIRKPGAYVSREWRIDIHT